jgi:hypothetical protein
LYVLDFYRYRLIEVMGARNAAPEEAAMRPAKSA